MISGLVSWCFEPSQPQRITSGLSLVWRLAVMYGGKEYASCTHNGRKYTTHHVRYAVVESITTERTRVFVRTTDGRVDILYTCSEQSKNWPDASCALFQSRNCSSERRFQSRWTDHVLWNCPCMKWELWLIVGKISVFLKIMLRLPRTEIVNISGKKENNNKNRSRIKHTMNVQHDTNDEYMYNMIQTMNTYMYNMIQTMSVQLDTNNEYMYSMIQTMNTCTTWCKQWMYNLIQTMNTCTTWYKRWIRVQHDTNDEYMYNMIQRVDNITQRGDVRLYGTCRPIHQCWFKSTRQQIKSLPILWPLIQVKKPVRCLLKRKKERKEENGKIGQS